MKKKGTCFTHVFVSVFFWNTPFLFGTRSLHTCQEDIIAMVKWSMTLHPFRNFLLINFYDNKVLVDSHSLKIGDLSI
mgnify:CR=1 FL=1